MRFCSTSYIAHVIILPFVYHVRCTFNYTLKRLWQMNVKREPCRQLSIDLLNWVVSRCDKTFTFGPCPLTLLNQITSLFSRYTSFGGTTTTGAFLVGRQTRVCALLALGRTRADFGMKFEWLLLLLSPPLRALFSSMCCRSFIDSLLLLELCDRYMGSLLFFKIIGCCCTEGLTICALEDESSINTVFPSVSYQYDKWWKWYMLIQHEKLWLWRLSKLCALHDLLFSLRI